MCLNIAAFITLEAPGWKQFDLVQLGWQHLDLPEVLVGPKMAVVSHLVGL